MRGVSIRPQAAYSTGGRGRCDHSTSGMSVVECGEGRAVYRDQSTVVECGEGRAVYRDHSTVVECREGRAVYRDRPAVIA